MARPTPIPTKIAEIIYSFRIWRDVGELYFKWLRQHERDLLVTHNPDGSITLEPFTENRYAVRATDDGMVTLRRRIKSKRCGVEVRHNDAGKITVTLWENVRREFPSGMSRFGLHYYASDDERTIVRYEDGFCTSHWDVHIPPGWDRTKAGLDNRSRELKDAELRRMVGNRRWRKILEDRRKASEYRAATEEQHHVQDEA